LTGHPAFTPRDEADNVLSAGNAKSLTVPGLGTSIGPGPGTFTFGPISTAATNFAFWYVFAGAPTGGATGPTLTFYVDYLGPDTTTVVAQGVVASAQFTTFDASDYHNIGPAPIAGGGGYMIPTHIQIRAVIGATAGTPTYPNIKTFLIGR
jgi:hypothetical protein